MKSSKLPRKILRHQAPCQPARPLCQREDLSQLLSMTPVQAPHQVQDVQVLSSPRGGRRTANLPPAQGKCLVDVPRRVSLPDAAPCLLAHPVGFLPKAFLLVQDPWRALNVVVHLDKVRLWAAVRPSRNKSHLARQCQGVSSHLSVYPFPVDNLFVHASDCPACMNFWSCSYRWDFPCIFSPDSVFVD